MRFISVVLSFSLLFSPSASYAQSALEALRLPAPGVMVSSSPSVTPPLLKGVVVNVNDPLALRFVINSGKSEISQADLRKAVDQQVRYFLAGLTVPSRDLWVNLSPYEHDRMIPDALGRTDLGRDMLAQDYILKQLSASMIHPDKDLGKVFWDRVYAQAQARFGTTDIPVDTFNKVWIMPDNAVIFEEGGRGYITKATLKVLLDEDYLALEKGRAQGAVSRETTGGDRETRALTTQVMREVVIPAITREVNEGANFAPLRQIYYALILAKWYKETVSNRLLEQVYFGKNQVSGVDLADPGVREGIYQRYIAAYKTGVFNYIKEEADPATGESFPRKYFSGGETFDLSQIPLQKTSDRSAITTDGEGVSVADIRLGHKPWLDAAGIERLIAKVESGAGLDPDEMAGALDFLRSKGFSSVDQIAQRMGVRALLQGLSLFVQFDQDKYARFDEAPALPQARAAQYIAVRLSDRLSTHEMSHLAHSIMIVGAYLSFWKDQLVPAGQAELQRLQEFAYKLEKENLEIRNVLGGFSVYSRPGFSVFLLERIRQHIRDSRELNDRSLAFTKEHPVLFEEIDPVSRLNVSIQRDIAAFEDKLNRLERDGLALEVAGNIDLFAMTEEIVADLKENYGIAVEFSSRSVPAQGSMAFSYYDLRGILEVLIDNARQAPRGADVPVTVNVSVERGEQGIILRVKDDGRGMTVEQLARVRASEAFTTKGALGSGQGLMAVREVVGAHSGTMEVDSVLGQGTTFTLWFPVGGSDVNNAMLTSAVSALAAIPLAAGGSFDPTSTWSVVAILSVGVPALVMTMRYWTIQHFKSVLRKTQDPKVFFKAAESLRSFVKEDVWRDELLARYMDMNPGIRAAERELFSRFGQIDPLFRWLESRNIFEQLRHPNAQVRDGAKALMGQFPFTPLERAEVCLLVLGRELGRDVPASLNIVQENLADLISFRKKARSASVAMNSRERASADFFDQKMIYILSRVLGWGPEASFPLAVSGLDELAPGMEKHIDLYRDIIESSPRSKVRMEVFQRLPLQMQKEMGDRLWDRFREPHMFFDVSVRFFLDTGLVGQGLLTARVLEILKKNHYMQDPLRAPHIRALETLGVKGFSQGMSQRQFEQVIDQVMASQPDRAMSLSALSVLAAAPVDPSVIDTLVNSPVAWVVVGGVVLGASVGSALLVRYWNIRKRQQLLSRVHTGSMPSRIDALIEYKGKVQEGAAYYEFLGLLNDPSAVFISSDQERLEQAGFSFGRWLGYDMPVMLISTDSEVREQARGLLKNKVSLLEQGLVRIRAIHREYMRLSNTRYTYRTNDIILELVDDLLSGRKIFQNAALDLEFEKVLLELFPVGDLRSMLKIRDALVELRLGKDTSDASRTVVLGRVNAELGGKFLERLKQPLPVMNVKDVVVFLLNVNIGNRTLILTDVISVLRKQGPQMDASLRKNYSDALTALGLPEKEQWLQAPLLAKPDGDRPDPSQDINGGIDVSGLNVERSGKGVDVVFDPAMLTGFANGTFNGFTPVIVGFTPAGNILSALGL